jgi:hypothetical protein
MSVPDTFTGRQDALNWLDGERASLIAAVYTAAATGWDDAAYGRDIRAWEGYPVLHEMRELSSLSAILRDGHTDPAAKRELVIRLRSLRCGDDQRWTSF